MLRASRPLNLANRWRRFFVMRCRSFVRVRRTAPSRRRWLWPMMAIMKTEIEQVSTSALVDTNEGVGVWLGGAGRKR
jgi:hypothetical protein